MNHIDKIGKLYARNILVNFLLKSNLFLRVIVDQKVGAEKENRIEFNDGLK